MILEYDGKLEPLNLDNINYEAVIFDIDGTLWPDSIRGEYLKLLEKRGLDWDSLNEFCENEKEKKGYYTMIEVFEQVGLSFMEFLKENDKFIIPYADVIPTLDALKLYNIKTGFVTDECREATLYKMECMNLLKYADCLLTTDEIKSMKPNPKGLSKALELLDSSSKNTLHVCDLIRDVKASNLASIDSALILRSTWPDRDKKQQPTFYINDLRDVFSIASPSFTLYDEKQRSEDITYLLKLIEKTLADFPEGGVKFFTNMDHRIKTDARIARLMLHETKKEFPDTEIIILSGEIGEGVWAFAPNFAEIIKVEGELRLEGKEIFNITPLNNQKCTFVDDTFYSGKTAAKVKRWAEKQNGEFLGCVATYDGSWDEKGRNGLEAPASFFEYQKYFNRNGERLNSQVSLAEEVKDILMQKK